MGYGLKIINCSCMYVFDNKKFNITKFEYFVRSYYKTKG